MDSTTQLTIHRTGTTTPARTSGSPLRPVRTRSPTPARTYTIPTGSPGRCTSGPPGYSKATGRERPRFPRTGCIRTSGPGTPFIAIGLRHLSPLRAQTELETLLGAQWGDGRIPHIVFNPSVPLDAYLRAPTSGAPRPRGALRAPCAPYRRRASCSHRCTRSPPGWCTRPTRACPGRVPSSPGCIPGWPPGTAICCTGGDLGGGGLASVVHPWEQGMDNSPCWDAPLSRVTPAAPRSFRRADLDHGSAEDRPTDLDYGRYVRLATDYRDGGYGSRRRRVRRRGPGVQRAADRLRARARRDRAGAGRGGRRGTPARNG